MSWTVGDLMDFLQHVPADTLVVLAKDEEGNGYSPLSDPTVGVYEAETTWLGEFYARQVLGDSDYGQPDGETVPAICFWPLN